MSVPTIRSFRRHVAQEVAVVVTGLGILTSDLDLSVTVCQGCAQVFVRDREFGRIFHGALRVGRTDDDMPALNAGLLRQAIESEVRRINGDLGSAVTGVSQGAARPSACKA